MFHFSNKWNSFFALKMLFRCLKILPQICKICQANFENNECNFGKYGRHIWIILKTSLKNMVEKFCKFWKQIWKILKASLKNMVSKFKKKILKASWEIWQDNLENIEGKFGKYEKSVNILCTSSEAWAINLYKIPSW